MKWFNVVLVLTTVWCSHTVIDRTILIGPDTACLITVVISMLSKICETSILQYPSLLLSAGTFG